MKIAFRKTEITRVLDYVVVYDFTVFESQIFPCGSLGVILMWNFWPVFQVWTCENKETKADQTDR